MPTRRPRRRVGSAGRIPVVFRFGVPAPIVSTEPRFGPDIKAWRVGIPGGARFPLAEAAGEQGGDLGAAFFAGSLRRGIIAVRHGRLQPKSSAESWNAGYRKLLTLWSDSDAMRGDWTDATEAWKANRSGSLPEIERGGRMANRERMAALRELAPRDAAVAWMRGAFGIGEESALCDALRKDPRITLSDREIIDAFCDAIDDELDADQCFERMVAGK